MPEALHAVVRGRVQGVFFRAFVRNQAQFLGLNGWVRNLSSGQEVEVWAEGERDQLEEMLRRLEQGPRSSQVEAVEVNWEATAGYRSFEVTR